MSHIEPEEAIAILTEIARDRSADATTRLEAMAAIDRWRRYGEGPPPDELAARRRAKRASR